MRSALPTHVFTLANSSPLIDQTCNHVAAHVAMSPVKSFIATAATGPACPRNCLTKVPLDKSHTTAVQSLEPETIRLYAGLAAKQVTASVWAYKLCFIPICFFLASYSHMVMTYM